MTRGVLLKASLTQIAGPGEMAAVRLSGLSTTTSMMIMTTTWDRGAAGVH